MPKAIPNRIATQFRIDDTIYKKAKVVAKSESRTLNSQVEYFIKKGVEQYEAENGEIILNENE